MRRLEQRLADQGLLIEAGWVGFRRMVLPAATGDAQVRDMQLSFFAGAKHLFDSVMHVLEPGNEVTAADMRAMESIVAELETFKDEMQVRFLAPRGNA